MWKTVPFFCVCCRRRACDLRRVYACKCVCVVCMRVSVSVSVRVVCMRVSVCVYACVSVCVES